MIWFGRHVSLLNSAYNCTMNDPIAYMGKHGWRRLLAKLRFSRNRRTLAKILGNDNLQDSIVVSERSIEIPLAVDFLNTWVKDEPVIELGCVLPYYIFKSPNHVVYDLMDAHPANTRKDIRRLDMVEFKSNIVSISTIEHISKGDYGINKTSVTAIEILRNIRDNAKKYFVTFPLGYNNDLDQYIMANSDDCVFLTRKESDKNDWCVVDDGQSLTDAQKKYGGYCCANTVCIASNCLSCETTIS